MSPTISAGKTVAVIMVGGPTKGTRFRPLSLNLAKPLFPLAGQPMVHHPVLSCKKIPNLAHIYLIGFYEEREFALYCSAISTELKIPVRYLREDRPHGSAGGLYSFKDLLLEEYPEDIIVLNCDVCCSFPLQEMLTAHKSFGGIGTLLVKKVSADFASQFGELVADPVSKELLHYAEKPETFVSDHINCGVYIFTPDIFRAIADVSTHRFDKDVLRRLNSLEALQSATKMSIRCSYLYLEEYQRITPELLAKGNNIVGNVFIHPSAKIHSTAKIGPNVSISPNARIGAGVRLFNCIILDDVEIMDNAIVMHAIIGWKSSIGRWSRVQVLATMPSNWRRDFNQKLGIAILGEDVTVEDEVVVIKSIVLPHKLLNSSVLEEIIL